MAPAAASIQVCGVPAICSWKRCTRRDLPIPASPMISATWPSPSSALLPTIHQRAQFVLAPDEWSQSARGRRRFQPPAHSAGLDYPVQLDRPLNALERRRPALLDHEQPRDQPMGILGYHHRAGSGGFLHARGDIGRVAEYVGVLARRPRPPPPHLNRSRPAPPAWAARLAR